MATATQPALIEVPRTVAEPHTDADEPRDAGVSAALVAAPVAPAGEAGHRSEEGTLRDPFAVAAASLRPSRRAARRAAHRSRSSLGGGLSDPGERAADASVVAGHTAGRSEDNSVGGTDAGEQLAAALAAIVAPLGVPEASQRDTVVRAVGEFLTGRNIDADVTSLRYGVLTLATDPALVEFVRCDTAELVEVCTGVGLELRDVRVRSRRR